MTDVPQTAQERNKQVVNRLLLDGFVGGDLGVWDELVSPDFVDKTAAQGAPNDRAAWVASAAMFQAAFPDRRLEVLHQVAEGDLVITHQRTTGTHAGELMGIAPTGDPVDVRAVNVDQLAGGLIVARWSLIDMLSLMRQIGALPTPGA
jgi:predicted ester cyclase